MNHRDSSFLCSIAYKTVQINNVECFINTNIDFDMEENRTHKKPSE